MSLSSYRHYYKPEHLEFNPFLQAWKVYDSYKEKQRRDKMRLRSHKSNYHAHNTSSKHHHNLNYFHAQSRKHKAHRGHHHLYRTKEEGEHGNNIHSGVQNWGSKVMINKLSHKSVEFHQGRVTYQQVTSGLSGSAAGVQGCSLLDAVGTVNQWLTSSGTALNYYATPYSETGFFKLNPNGNIAGPLISVTNQLATDRFFLSSVNWKASVTNFESIASTCWIYVCKSVCNHNFEPAAALGQAITQEGLGLAVGTQAAAGASSGGTYGVPGITFPGVTPGNIKNFNKFWRVKKVHRIDLAAGATEDVSFHLRMNQMGSIARFIDINPTFTTSAASWTVANTTVNYPSGSCAIFIVVRGSPVRDRTAAGVGFPTYGSSSLGFIIDKIHHFYPVKDQAARIDFDTGYNQLPAAAIADQKTINEIDAIQATQVV